MKKAVFVLLLMAPVFYSGIFSVRDIREQQFFVLVCAAALFLGMNCLNRIMGLGVVYCLCTLAFFQRPAYINNMVQICAHVMIYDFTAKHYKGREYPWPILMVLLANVLMAVLQYFKQDVFLQIGLFTDQTPGFMTLPVYIGIYAAVVAPILYRIHPLTIFISIAGVLFSRSSFAAIAMAVSMSFYLWRTKSKIFRLWVLSAAAALFWFTAIYDGPTGQFGRRIHIWRMVGSAIAVNPWGGWGIGSYDRHIRFVEIGNGDKTRKYAMYQPHKEEHIERLSSEIEFVAATEIGNDKVDEIKELSNLQETKEWFQKNGSDIYWWQDPHNGYLLAWFEGGLPLLILVVWYIFDIGKRYLKSKMVLSLDTHALFASFISVVIVSAAHFAIQIPRLSITIMVLLSILDQRLRNKGVLSEG